MGKRSVIVVLKACLSYFWQCISMKYLNVGSSGWISGLHDILRMKVKPRKTRRQGTQRVVHIENSYVPPPPPQYREGYVIWQHVAGGEVLPLLVINLGGVGGTAQDLPCLPKASQTRTTDPLEKWKEDIPLSCQGSKMALELIWKWVHLWIYFVHRSFFLFSLRDKFSSY